MIPGLVFCRASRVRWHQETSERHIGGRDVAGEASLDQFGAESFIMLRELGGIDVDSDEALAGVADGAVLCE